MVAGVGGGRGGGGGMYLLQPFPPLIYQYFPTFQCNTQQVVFKPVISAGEFHVSGKKIHLKKIGDEV